MQGTQASSPSSSHAWLPQHLAGPLTRACNCPAHCPSSVPAPYPPLDQMSFAGPLAWSCPGHSMVLGPRAGGMLISGRFVLLVPVGEGGARGGPDWGSVKWGAPLSPRLMVLSLTVTVATALTPLLCFLDPLILG